MTEPQTGAYWAVITSDVLCDSGLRPSAKLLYAHLTRMANHRGYCWADNEYLGKLLGLAPETVSRLVSQLHEKGYIRCEIVPNNKGIERRIYAGAFVVSPAGGLDENVKKGLDKNVKKGLDKNVNALNVEKDNIKIPPIVPQVGQRVRKRKEPRAAPDWQPERFAGFWTFYPPKGRKAKQAAIDAWDKLRPSDKLIATIGLALKMQKASDEWMRGIGIPYASTYLNQRRWEDAAEMAASEPQSSGWADDPEVL